MLVLRKVSAGYMQVLRDGTPVGEIVKCTPHRWDGSAVLAGENICVHAGTIRDAFEILKTRYYWRMREARAREHCGHKLVLSDYR